MLRYIGDGAFLPGVPARDLTAEEVEASGGADALIASGLYAKAGPKKKSLAEPYLSGDMDAIVSQLSEAAEAPQEDGE